MRVVLPWDGRCLPDVFWLMAFIPLFLLDHHPLRGGDPSLECGYADVLSWQQPAMPPSKEIPLQQAMFTDELVDTRSRAQKSRDRASKHLQQMSMFSVRETVQYGISARPWLKDLPAPKLALEILDVRTEEDKERERRRVAEAMTAPMFGSQEATRHHPAPLEGKHEPVEKGITSILCRSRRARPLGFRAQMRQGCMKVPSKQEQAVDEIALKSTRDLQTTSKPVVSEDILIYWQLRVAHATMSV